MSGAYRGPTPVRSPVRLLSISLHLNRIVLCFCRPLSGKHKITILCALRVCGEQAIITQ